MIMHATIQCEQYWLDMQWLWNSDIPCILHYDVALILMMMYTCIWGWWYTSEDALLCLMLTSWWWWCLDDDATLYTWNILLDDVVCLMMILDEHFDEDDDVTMVDEQWNTYSRVCTVTCIQLHVYSDEEYWHIQWHVYNSACTTVKSTVWWIKILDDVD